MLNIVSSSLFPQPTGPFGVGKMKYHTIDTSRRELNDLKSYRELMVYIWYPTDSKTSQATTPYDEDALKNFRYFMSKRTGIPIWIVSCLLRNIKTYAQENISPLSAASNYPVIIMEHGRGPMIQQYTALCEELASHGYIIVGINHPYVAAATRFPDNRVIKTLVGQPAATQEWKQQQFELAEDDIKFILEDLVKRTNQPTWLLHKKLDLNHIGIAGHSAGGSVAMRMCLENSHFKAGISLDGTTRGNRALSALKTPFLCMLGQKSHTWADDNGQRDLEKLKQLCHVPGMNMTIITLEQVGHLIFSDLPLLLNANWPAQTLSRVIDTDMNAPANRASRAHTIVKKYMVQFFDHHVKNKQSALFVQPHCDVILDT